MGKISESARVRYGIDLQEEVARSGSPEVSDVTLAGALACLRAADARDLVGACYVIHLAMTDRRELTRLWAEARRIEKANLGFDNCGDATIRAINGAHARRRARRARRPDRPARGHAPGVRLVRRGRAARPGRRTARRRASAPSRDDGGGSDPEPGGARPDLTYGARP